MSSVSGCGGAGSAAQYQSMQSARVPDAQRAQQLLSKLDVNGDGSIDASELKSFTQFVADKTGTSAIDASQLLSTLDSDGDGKVSSAELQDNGKALFDALRQQLSGSPVDSSSNQSGVDKMFASLDSNGDGSISKDEFKAGAAQHHHGGHHSMIGSLLEQYAASNAGSTSVSSLDAAA